MLEGKRILIVDDEFLIALMAEEMVRELNAVPVGPAASVTEGLEHVRAGNFDAAILDVNLRGIESEAIARELSARQIPFVIVTGYGAVNWPGIDAPVLMKPYEPQAIAKALQSALAARAAN